jgi:hypothetical protein
MKLYIVILFFSLGIKSFAQIDTTLDYLERFYQNDSLTVTNTLTNGLKDGIWIEFFR